MAVVGKHNHNPTKRGPSGACRSSRGWFLGGLLMVMLLLVGLAGRGVPQYPLSDMLLFVEEYTDMDEEGTTITTTTPTETAFKSASSSTSSPQPTLSDFRLCRVTPTPKVGGRQVLMNDYDANKIVSVDYQCAGEPYEEFGRVLEDLILSTATHRRGKKFWGRRKRILPLDNNNNNGASSTAKEEEEEPERSILIMGNSHTRQIVTTLICQYRDQLVKPPELLYSMPGNSLYGVQKMTFQKNIVVYTSTNCPFIYSPTWQWSLHNILTGSNYTADNNVPSSDDSIQPLSFLSAIVLGRFNDYGNSVGTRFVETMTTFQNEHPEFRMDFQHSKTPRIQDVAAVFAGPIVFVGMFAHYGTVEWKEAVTSVHRMRRDRNNLYVLHGRQYIEILHQHYDHPNNHNNNDKPKSSWNNNDPTLPFATTTTTTKFPVAECASDGRNLVETCVTNTSSFRFQNGHRCTGQSGGHADLIVWDLVDVLWDVFRPSTSNVTSTTTTTTTLG